MSRFKSSCPWSNQNIPLYLSKEWRICWCKVPRNDNNVKIGVQCCGTSFWALQLTAINWWVKPIKLKIIKSTTETSPDTAHCLCTILHQGLGPKTAILASTIATKNKYLRQIKWFVISLSTCSQVDNGTQTINLLRPYLWYNTDRNDIACTVLPSLH